MTDEHAIGRFDGWASDMGSLGSMRDKARGIHFERRAWLDKPQLDALYTTHALAARIVDLIVDEAFRTPWSIKAADVAIDPVQLSTWCDELHVDREIMQTLKWGRLYGGAVCVLPTSGHDVTGPLMPAEQLHPLAAVAAHAAIPGDYDSGFGSATFRQTLWYDLQLETKVMQHVHHSRVIPFEPIVLPYDVMALSPTRWGPSVLDRVFDELSAYGGARSHALSMMYTASLLYVQLSGLRDEYKSKGGPARVRTRLQNVRSQLDALGILGLDVDDKIGALSLTATGVHELIDRLSAALVAGQEAPREILFNESPAGLNAGELSGPQELWFGKIATFREQVVTPMLRRIVSHLLRSHGVDVGSFEINWAPLWVPSETSVADNAGKWAAIDTSYVAMGLPETDVLRQRFVEGNRGPIVMPAEPEVAPLDLSAEVEAHTAAIAAPAAPAAAPAESPADTAMNGAQVASLLEILRAVNAGELSYEQGIGALGVAFPTLRGREASVLGPPRPVAPAAAPAVEPQLDDVNAPDDPPPSPHAPPPDLVSPREAAEAWHVPTRTITLAIQRGALDYWGLGSHRRVSLEAVGRLAKSHESHEEDPADAEPEA